MCAGYEWTAEYVRNLTHVGVRGRELARQAFTEVLMLSGITKHKDARSRLAD